MIPAAELTALQAAVTATFDQAVVIKRNSPVKDIAGSQSDNYATVVSTHCHVGRPSASVAQQYAQKIGSLAAYVVRLPSGTNVLAADNLVIGSTTLRVQVVMSPRSYPIAMQVLATELQ